MEIRVEVMSYEKRTPCADCGDFEPVIVALVISYFRCFCGVAGHILDELRQAEDSLGCTTILFYGVIGSYLNDFPKTFSTLRGADFDGWVPIEDGVNGFDESGSRRNFCCPSFTAQEAKP